MFQAREGVSRKEIFPISLLLIAFSIPLETLLPYYFGLRTHAFYLSILAAVLAAIHLDSILQCLSRSSGLRTLGASFFWTSLMYFINPIRPNREYFMLIQLIIFSIMFLYIAEIPVWRSRLIWSYWLGWVVLCLLSLIFYLNNNLITFTSRVTGAERVINVLGFSVAQHGAQTAAGLMVTVVLASQQKFLVIRLVLLSTILFASLVILMTSSRTAILSLLITLILYMYLESRINVGRRFFSNIPYLTILIVCVLFILIAVPVGSFLLDNFLIRMNLTLESGDTAGRVFLAQAGLKLAQSNLLWGIGQGNAQRAVIAYLPDLEDADLHNYYLRMLVEGGLVGLGLFLVGTYLIVHRGWIWYQVASDGVYFFPLILLLLIAAAGRPFHYKLLWFFLALNALTPRKSPTDIVSESSE